jgi:hypothetical protein
MTIVLQVILISEEVSLSLFFYTLLHMAVELGGTIHSHKDSPANHNNNDS